MVTWSRRGILAATAGLGAGFALAACGGDATPAAAPAASQAGPTKITYWGAFSGNLGKSQEDVVKQFNDSQKAVVVEHQFQGSYAEAANKLTAALQAKQAPELCVLSDVWWYKFYLNKTLQPLDDLMKAEKVDTKDYVDSLFNEYRQGDKSYALPFARSTPLFYYNKDLWKKAGLPERAPKTWDELTKDFVPKLKGAIDSKQFIFAHPSSASYIAWVFQGVIWQWGGSYSDKDFKILISEAKSVQAGEFYRASVKDGWAQPSKDVDADFRAGVAVCLMGSTGGLVGHEQAAQGKFEVGTGFLPEGPAGFGCPTGGAGIGMLAGLAKEKQAAAMQFLNFSTNTKTQAFWSQQTGYMPVRKSAIDSKEMQDFLKQKPNFKTALDQLPKTKFQDSARVFIPNGDEIIGKGLERITVQGEAPTAVWKDIADTLTKEAEPVLKLRKALGG